MLMINDEGERHAVTPIMVNEGGGLRMSVQIFCALPGEELNQGRKSEPIPPKGSIERKMMRVSSDLSHKLGRKPTESEIAAAMKLKKY